MVSEGVGASYIDGDNSSASNVHCVSLTGRKTCRPGGSNSECVQVAEVTVLTEFVNDIRFTFDVRPAPCIVGVVASFCSHK